MIVIKCDVCGKVIEETKDCRSSIDNEYAEIEISYKGKEWENVRYRSKRLGTFVCSDCIGKIEEILGVKGDKTDTESTYDTCETGQCCG